jgi:hypothetical protein
MNTARCATAAKAGYAVGVEVLTLQASWAGRLGMSGRGGREVAQLDLVSAIQQRGERVQCGALERRGRSARSSVCDRRNRGRLVLVLYPH